MSWQAMTAVSRHSKQDGQALRLILRLAEFADAEGTIDPAPNQQTLAEYFGVTGRTIRNRLNEIEAQQELAQTRVGSGPGKPSAYKILLPMPEKEEKAEKGMGFVSAFQQKEVGAKAEKAEIITGFVSAFQQEMAEIKAEISSLKAEISDLKAETKGGKGGNEEGERRKGHSSKSAHDPFDPSLDPFKERKSYIYEHPEPEDDFYSLITALSGICKTQYWAKTEAEYSSAAAVLLSDGATPERVKEFGTWWAANGHYVGKPALTSVMTNWSNYVDGVTAPSANGKKALCPDCGEVQHGAVCLFCAGIIQH